MKINKINSINSVSYKSRTNVLNSLDKKIQKKLPVIEDFFVKESEQIVSKESESTLMNYIENLHQKKLLEEFLNM